MLSERQLQDVLAVFEKRMQKVIEQYLIIMGEHIRDIGKLTPSDVNRLVQLKRVNANMEKIKRQVAKAAKQSLDDVETAFRAVAESDYRFAAEVFGEDHTPSVKSNKYLERILKAQLRITKQELANISRTTIIPDLYRDAVDLAIQTVQAGVTDYNSAIRTVMKSAAQAGLRVEYPSGLTRRLDTAIRMNILDGVRAINRDVMEQAGKEFKADGIELSAHALCAEDHLPYQGTQMSMKEFDRLQNRLDRPFGMWNCKHFWWPILLGISQPTHTREELRAYAENSNEPITIDGVTKTRYQWTQEQRRLETHIRYQKDAANLYKASGDMVGRRNAQATINALRERYANVSEAAGLREDVSRMRVAGFARVKTADQLKNVPKYGIIKADDGKVYMRIYNADGKEKYRYLQTDAIQKLNSTEEIAHYFIYTDKYGEKRSPCSDEFTRNRNSDGELPPIKYHLAGFKLETQREIAEGIQWAQTTYKLDVLPNIITKAQTPPKSTGAYDPASRTVKITHAVKLEESFATAVHEMTHFADAIHGHIAQSICEQARKNLGFSANNRMYKNALTAIAQDDKDDPAEVLAFALERHATNRANQLANEIARLFIERMYKK